MHRMRRFGAVLLVSLGILAGLGYLARTRVTRSWFQSDLALRSQLAVASARERLASHWTSDPAHLTKTLADITRDERIMAAAACTKGGELRAATESSPAEFSCRSDLQRKREGGPGAQSLSMVADLPSGPVHLSATLLPGEGGPLGAILLGHDLSYLERREATTRRLLLAAFFVLSLGGGLVALTAARFAWRGWTTELRRALTGQPTREFQPLLRDVRALAERLSQERERESGDGIWSPARLRSTLTQHLQGERIVLLANRAPYVHLRTPEGVTVLHPASGLVRALEPVLRACSGVWVAHGSGSAARETSEAQARVRVPPGEESYLIRRVWLSGAEENGYYYGLSNEGLWPLCHVAHMRPVFRAEDWDCYVSVIR